MAGRPAKPMLSPEEIQRPFTGEWGDRYPPILSPQEVSKLLGLSIKTIYEWRAKGRFDGSVVKRGKHLRFWRDKVIENFFNSRESANE